MGYSFRLAGWDVMYAPSHRQDSTYLRLCYTSCAALAGTRNRERFTIDLRLASLEGGGGVNNRFSLLLLLHCSYKQISLNILNMFS